MTSGAGCTQHCLRQPLRCAAAMVALLHAFGKRWRCDPLPIPRGSEQGGNSDRTVIEYWSLSNQWHATQWIAARTASLGPTDATRRWFQPHTPTAANASERMGRRLASLRERRLACASAGNTCIDYNRWLLPPSASF